MIATYLTVTIILNFALTVIWSKRTWLNIFIKGIFAATAVFGLILLGIEYGFVVKV